MKNRMISSAYLHGPGIVLGSLISLAAIAQTAPDAGQLLQQNRPAPDMPAPSPVLPGSQGAPSQAEAQPAGAQVLLREVQVQQVPGIDGEQLLRATGLDKAVGQSLDLAGLRSLADRVTSYLRDSGYLVARAWLPEQDLSSGVLQINILVGKYGQVQVTGSDEETTASAQRWLAAVRPGEVITQKPLHRGLLLLSDLPSVKTRSVLRPGAEPGEADLLLEVEPTKKWTGRVGADNHGNRYAGRERVNASFDVYPGWVFGDRLSVDMLATREKTWQGSASYSLPLGVDGWRLQTQLARTDYQLGREFAALGAHGTADIAQLSLSYPLLRTSQTNIRASMGVQHRAFKDVRDAAASSAHKSADLAQLSLNADWLEPNAVTWGGVSFNAGKLHLNAAEQQIDSTTAGTAGRYNRVNLDAVRLQAITGNWNVYARVAAQWANKNLDASEKMVLGGATGVRAWPSGEASGDRGWLSQLELRWRLNAQWQPYAFVDGGSVRVNAAPWVAGNNSRSIAGRGIGVRYEALPIKFDIALARRNGAAKSQAEASAARTRLWVSASYSF